MSEQYFTQHPQSKSNPKTWTYELRNQVLTFTSDTGVFSKNTVDFGSKTLIESFILPEADGAIVDLGCGYGPIGLSIAKAFPDRQIVMGDINERAVELAKINMERNKLTNARVFLSDQFSQLPNETYAAVLTNPPIRVGKKVVHEMFEQAHQHLCSDGELWVVIQKKQGAPSAIKKMESLFRDVEVVCKEKGYFIIRAIK
ncbi:class I SAM-dependent methyltransferase [Amphibacillus xylanus]|uniref:Putative methyltransferase n=1 Tax=Amphibacillus xylanus (strain ATCC 51415 / DSM 6626 / JCM 7361 / LMG 17667 / NBRC 15112 / Ep01) TaxID=698758 RepID=K0J174_AMPXN|nr:class I SAM-dependent methyltransferase [Amphibacillus xylanus]BAM46246.1 putative methyltransferase [Amphibacillus xylanus NBRC 15112]